MTTLPNLFITGSHRSGSSWVGQMLAAAGGYTVRDEEMFNYASEIATMPFDYSYPYICQQNEAAFIPFVDKAVACKYSLAGGLKKVRSFRDVLRVGRRKLRAVHRLLSPPRHVIYVEPTGLMTAEWFAKRFSTPVILVVRHPAAFVSSLKKLNWGFNFTHFSRQTLLMDRFFQGYAKEIENAPRRPDIVGISILLWKLLYHVVDVYRQEHPDWIVLRHEDLSADPLSQFRVLYQRLGLIFTPACEEVIRHHSLGEGGAEFTGKKDKSIRNSKEVIKIWKNRLSVDEIARIREHTEPVASRFYEGSSWE